MTKYLGQRDTFRCCPIAIVNALKWAKIKTWAGLPVNEKLAKTVFSYFCDCEEDIGSDHSATYKFLKQIKELFVFRVPHPTYKNLIGHMKDGGAAIIHSKWYGGGEWIYHMWFLSEVQKDYVVGINYRENKKISRIKRDTFRQKFYNNIVSVYFVDKAYE
jgi:hypothetical protein